MLYDTEVPQNLQTIQEWFASIINRPIDLDSKMMLTSPSGISMEEEAKHYIVPSPTMQPAERIQLYNQQYWWRLLSVLQESFPLATRLFGYTDFNQSLAIPYLVKYPPRHWSLNFLGDRFVQWIEEEYHAEDKKFVKNAIEIDYAFDEVFFEAKYPPIDLNNLPDGQDISAILDKTIYLQPYVRLFEMEYDLFNFRVEMLKENPDYWLEHDFPKLDKDEIYHFVLSRNHNSDIIFKQVPATAFRILQLFKQEGGTNIDAICEWIEKQGENVCEEATNHLQSWFQDWTLREWLTFKNEQ